MSRPQLKQEFLDSLSRHKEFDGLADALLLESQTSVRLHPLRGNGLFEGEQEVPWCPSGRYLETRPDFTRDPAMHQGRYYVQEASSMFLHHILSSLSKSMGPVALLDACAAPGGKSTTAADALPEGSLVVSNELSPQRAAALCENIIKWGHEACVVTRGNAAHFGKLKEAFDIILVDAPCSGEGMMRKEPKAVEQWSPALVAECAATQRQIVDSLWGALKPGGYLVYSTCTFNRNEDEEIVEHILSHHGAESVGIPIDSLWGISPAIDSEASCYRFLPGRTRGEGLFMAVLRKPGELAPITPKPVKTKSNPLALRILSTQEMEFSEHGDMVSAFPARWIQLLAQIGKVADIIHFGVTVGEKAGKDFAPTQSLALSRVLNSSEWPQVEVDTDTALAYLRRQAITLPDGSPRGYVLLTHRNYPLGFAKNLGNRANNLYPRQWRILSTY